MRNEYEQSDDDTEEVTADEQSDDDIEQKDEKNEPNKEECETSEGEDDESDDPDEDWLDDQSDFSQGELEDITMYNEERAREEAEGLVTPGSPPRHN